MTERTTIRDPEKPSDRTSEQKSLDGKMERIDVCPECGGGLVNDNSGERYCEDCGVVVIEQQIDRGPEWRAYTHDGEQKRSRVGEPTTGMLHDRGLTTDISWKDEDAYGRPLEPEQRRRMNRLRKQHHRSRVQSGERTLKKGLEEINRMAPALGIPTSTQETAATLYRQAANHNLLKGHSIEGIASGSLHAACRLEEIPRSLPKLATVSRVDENTIAAAYRYVDRELGLETPPPAHEKYIPSIASDVEAPEAVKQKAADVLETYLEEGDVGGRNPRTVGGAAVYIAAILTPDTYTVIQDEIAEAADITTPTIRDCVYDMLRAAGYDPEETIHS